MRAAWLKAALFGHTTQSSSCSLDSKLLVGMQQAPVQVTVVEYINEFFKNYSKRAYGKTLLVNANKGAETLMGEYCSVVCPLSRCPLSRCPLPSTPIEASDAFQFVFRVRDQQRWYSLLLEQISLDAALLPVPSPSYADSSCV